jgi:phytoene dehydrogenase-like protein
VPDAVVVGSGPNGLAAAIVLTRAGLNVEVIEGAATIGGGCRTEQRTLPGFLHDTCSTVQALAMCSPFFTELDLATMGVRFLQPRVAFAHPLDGGRAAAVTRSVEETAAGLGADARAYRRLLGPLVANADSIIAASLAPIRSVPRAPLRVGRFAALGALPTSLLVRRFDTDEARGLLAGVSAHSIRPLQAPLTSGFGLLLTMVAHHGGWPVVEGGSGRLADAMAAWLTERGATLRTGQWVHHLDELPTASATLLDTSARDLARIAAGAIRPRERRSLERVRFGPGLCKVDWALSGPVPWTAPACREAGTIHVGGTFEEVAAAMADVHAGRHAERPFCIIVQPGIVDASRAPVGSQTLWGYCHVPAGSTRDMTASIESQIERFAPGFGELVLARRTTAAAELEAANPNYVGGDITGGATTVRQTFFRPTVRWDPYRTTVDGLYLCSSATPPGGGVHGMCGVGAARSALRAVLGR